MIGLDLPTNRALTDTGCGENRARSTSSTGRKAKDRGHLQSRRTLRKSLIGPTGPDFADKLCDINVNFPLKHIHKAKGNKETNLLSQTKKKE